jgi:hypothetical protein
VRGAGHFERTLAFLRVLRELGVSTMVMLTLTADNIDQVLPLTRRLRGLADDFHFNRLAMVGEGASLRLPSRAQRYAPLLEEYLAAPSTRRSASGQPVNIVRRRQVSRRSGGTGSAAARVRLPRAARRPGTPAAGSLAGGGVLRQGWRAV